MLDRRRVVAAQAEPVEAGRRRAPPVALRTHEVDRRLERRGGARLLRARDVASRRGCAEVTHDFGALVVKPPPFAASFETGAQNCEREPFSDSASVVRCWPAAISRRMRVLVAERRRRGDRLRAATCITKIIAVEPQARASSSTTAANARGPWPLPPSDCAGRTSQETLRARARPRSPRESAPSRRPRRRDGRAPPWRGQRRCRRSAGSAHRVHRRAAWSAPPGAVEDCAKLRL